MLSQVHPGDIAYQRPQTPNWLPRRARFGSSSWPFPPHPWRTTSPRFLLCLVRNRNLRPARYLFFNQYICGLYCSSAAKRMRWTVILKLFVKQLVVSFVITNGKLPPHPRRSIYSTLPTLDRCAFYVLNSSNQFSSSFLSRRLQNLFFKIRASIAHNIP